MVRRCRLAKMVRVWSVTSVRTVERRTVAARPASARGLWGGIFTTSIPAPARTASNTLVELPHPVPDQGPEVRGTIA